MKNVFIKINFSTVSNQSAGPTTEVLSPDLLLMGTTGTICGTPKVNGSTEVL